MIRVVADVDRVIIDRGDATCRAVLIDREIAEHVPEQRADFDRRGVVGVDKLHQAQRCLRDEIFDLVE